MKKEAREQAAKIFLDSQGKISNVEIAKRVRVNPLNVGRWKREDDWASKLTQKTKKRKEKAEPAPVRKKAAHDQALKLYLESEGNIENTQIARTVGVSAATIAKWKGSERWAEMPKKAQVAVAPAQQVVTTEPAEEIEIDVDALASPEHITLLNKRIEDMLAQAYLSPAELKTLAEAKEAVLAAVNAYLDVIDRMCED